MAIIRAKRGCYLIPEMKTTYTVWHPQVNFQGKWCYLPDDSTASRLVETESELEAYELAIKALKDIGTTEST